MRRSNIPTFRWSANDIPSFGASVAARRPRLIAIVALVVPLAPHLASQSHAPRFERSDCWVAGDWARDARRECGWLVVRESRDRASARHSASPWKSSAPGSRAAQLPRVFLHGGPGGAGGIRLYSEGVARRAHPSRHRDVVIYDQRGAGLSEPKLCPVFDAVADAALIEAGVPVSPSSRRTESIDTRTLRPRASPI